MWLLRKTHITNLNIFLDFPSDQPACLTEKISGYLSPKWLWISAKIIFYWKKWQEKETILYKLINNSENLNTPFIIEINYCLKELDITKEKLLNIKNITDCHRIIKNKAKLFWSITTNNELRLLNFNRKNKSSIILQTQFLNFENDIYKLPELNKNKIKKNNLRKL